MKKLQSLKEDLFNSSKIEDTKKIFGGLATTDPNYSVTWHKSTCTQTDDGIDGGDV